MKLRKLIEGYETEEVKGDLDVEVSGITNDSRTVKPGYLFFALRGERVDGNDFISQAVSAGAVAVVTEQQMQSMQATYIRVNDVHDAMAFISDKYYGHPSGRFYLIGITGTNGKTTTAYLIYQMLEGMGKKAGLTGTIRYIVGSKLYNAHLTTPTSLEFQRLLSEMVKEDMEVVVSEVSSHALHQKRVAYSEFDAGVFTNLSHDHLDYHGDMESYFQAKEMLFKEFDLKTAVINIDDPYGARLISRLNDRELRLISCGIKEDALLKAGQIRAGMSWTSMVLTLNGASYSVESPLLGVTNVYNLLLALGTMVAIGFELEELLHLIPGLCPAEGRMELIREGQPFTVVVDYAHTPDALEKLLETVRGFSKKRVITLFGCGGNRDRKKRPEMGAIAERFSDIVVVTTDNPRYEDEREIIEDILRGMNDRRHIVVQDRAQAIEHAVKLCEPDDVLVIAGKGHEDYQEIRGKRIHFDDREVVREAIKRQGACKTNSKH